MNKAKTTLILLLALVLSAVVNAQSRGNNNVDTPAGRLADRLTSIQKRGYMAGHQDDPFYGLTWEWEYGRSDIRELVGDYPAVMGFDLGGIEMGDAKNLDSVPFLRIREQLIAHVERGGIVTLSWHPRNPLTGGTAWDVKAPGVVTSILPGGSQHQKFQLWMQRVGDFIATLKDSKGQPVPIIFRPWHENNGSWFWWGQKNCTDLEFRNLWNMLQDYLNGRGFSNLLWSYSPNLDGQWTTERFLQRYPGNSRVTLVGEDAYQWGTEADFKTAVNADLKFLTEFSRKNDKLLALTECGLKNMTDTTWWTRVLMPVMDKYPICYFLLWRNYKKEFFGPSKNHPCGADYKKLYEAENTLFLNDIRIPRTEGFPEGSYSPVTNVNRSGYPRVLASGSVMFRVNAPQAQKVQIDLGGTKYDMLKSEGGAWTVTTQPQVPGFHYYSLIVDGVSTADPASQSFFGCSRWSSAIEIKETGMDDFEVQNVPHGEVHTVYYYSKVEEAWRPLLIYTPAGYRSGKTDYPVVYIQHGGGEDHRGWMEQGRTAQIMDNLIAAGKAVPMVVVSSNSNVRSRNGGMGGGYSWQGMQAFRSELLENVIPFVEKNYRVRKDPKGRALCGLSMGGGQSFYIGLRDPDVFANVGVFSTGMFGGIQGASNFDLEKEVPGILTDTKTFNRQFDVFFVSCGEQDPRIQYTRDIVKKMRDNSVEVRFNSYPGDHEWQVWRKSLHEFAQYLFIK